MGQIVPYAQKKNCIVLFDSKKDKKKKWWIQLQKVELNNSQEKNL